MSFSKILRRFSRVECGIDAPNGDTRGWQLVLRRTGFERLLAAVALVLGGIWLFLDILEDILSEDPLVTVDRILHNGLQRFRIPVLDHLMVAVSELGDAAVTVPVFIAVLVALLYLRTARTAFYWTVAVVMAEVSVKVAKFAVHRLRPVSIYDGIESYSFPSSHAALSIVVYGFLAYLVCRGRARESQLRIALSTGALIVLISISRLYLGVHWFSDVMAGLSLGTAWIAFLSVSHHLRDGDRQNSFVLWVVSLVTFLTSATIHITLHHDIDMIRYAMKPRQWAKTGAGFDNELFANHLRTTPTLGRFASGAVPRLMLLEHCTDLKPVRSESTAQQRLHLSKT